MLNKIDCKIGTKVLLSKKSSYYNDAGSFGQLPPGVFGTIISIDKDDQLYCIEVEWSDEDEEIETNYYRLKDLVLAEEKSNATDEYEII